MSVVERVVEKQVRSYARTFFFLTIIILLVGVISYLIYTRPDDLTKEVVDLVEKNNQYIKSTKDLIDSLKGRAKERKVVYKTRWLYRENSQAGEIQAAKYRKIIDSLNRKVKIDYEYNPKTDAELDSTLFSIINSARIGQ